MSEAAPERRPTGKKAGKKFGGLPGWAWFAIAGGAALIWWVWHKNQQTQQAQQQPGQGQGQFPYGGAYGPAGGRVVVPVNQGANAEELQDILQMDRRIWEAILDLQGQEAKKTEDKDKTDRDRQREDDDEDRDRRDKDVVAFQTGPSEPGVVKFGTSPNQRRVRRFGTGPSQPRPPRFGTSPKMPPIAFETNPNMPGEGDRIIVVH